MIGLFVASFLKKYSPVDAKGKPRPLTDGERKDVLDALKPVLEGIADYADKHDVFVPAFDVEAKGVRVRLTVERLKASA